MLPASALADSLSKLPEICALPPVMPSEAYSELTVAVEMTSSSI